MKLINGTVELGPGISLLVMNIMTHHCTIDSEKDEVHMARISFISFHLIRLYKIGIYLKTHFFLQKNDSYEKCI